MKAQEERPSVLFSLVHTNTHFELSPVKKKQNLLSLRQTKTNKQTQMKLLHCKNKTDIGSLNKQFQIHLSAPPKQKS